VKLLNDINMKTKLALLIFTFFSLPMMAQDPEFTQFYASPIYTNPAMAGTADCSGGGRASLNYRNQWPNLPGTLVTSAFSWDQHFEKVSGGFAILATHDVAGEGLLTTSALSGIYSYRLELNRKLTIIWAIEGQYIQRKLDFSKLRFADQIVASRGFINKTNEQLIDAPIIMPNMSTGMVLFTDRVYAGIAVHNVIEPIQTFYQNTDSKLPRRYTVHAGSKIPLDRRKNSQRTLSPNILFMLQNKFTQLNLGFYYTERSFLTGLWYRQTFGEFHNADALMLLVGFKKDNFKFGYSVDFTVSDAQAAAPVSHEISTSMQWCPQKKPPKYREFPCAWK
jgi:type IX secretion system PorP/SprF family membrane protein